MGKTTISWCTDVWNPIRGCSRVSEGCRNCYAESIAARFSGPGQPYEGLADRSRPGSKWTGEVRFVAEHLADPLRWKRPRRIFVNSMSDLFHEKLTNEQIAAVFGVMAAAPQHTFQVLTKRANRMREWFEWAATHESIARRCLDEAVDTHKVPLPADVAAARSRMGRIADWPLSNVWLGVSVENQAAADERIPELLATPAAVRFLSCEPLLSEVSIPAYLAGHPRLRAIDEFLDRTTNAIDWVIAGCESAHGARPCSVDWLRSLRDQCAASGTAFFLKQAVATRIGRCGDAGNPNGDDPCGEEITAYVCGPGHASYSCACCVEGPEDGDSPAVGAGEGSERKQRGLVELPYLDGVQHAAFPTVRT